MTNEQHDATPTETVNHVRCWDCKHADDIPVRDFDDGRARCCVCKRSHGGTHYNATGVIRSL